MFYCETLFQFNLVSLFAVFIHLESEYYVNSLKHPNIHSFAFLL